MGRRNKVREPQQDTLTFLANGTASIKAGCNPFVSWTYDVRNVVYIEQGLTDDSEYLVSYFYSPVSTAELPNSIDEVSEGEFNQVNSDWATYRQETEDLLNSLSASDWDPELTTLDELIGSLQFGDYGQ